MNLLYPINSRVTDSQTRAAVTCKQNKTKKEDILNDI